MCNTMKTGGLKWGLPEGVLGCSLPSTKSSGIIDWHMERILFRLDPYRYGQASPLPDFHNSATCNQSHFGHN